MPPIVAGVCKDTGEEDGEKESFRVENATSLELATGVTVN
jgi:hypothetical protein